VGPEVPTGTARTRRVAEQAVATQVVVRIDYRDRNGATTRRSVDPVGFFGGSDGWYLVGWCHLRRAARMFRLDRIERARLTRTPAGRHDVDDTLGWVPVTGHPPE
jgi:predicted DNA-binding transcriptional regulator YafY